MKNTDGNESSKVKIEKMFESERKKDEDWGETREDCWRRNGETRMGRAAGSKGRGRGEDEEMKHLKGHRLRRERQKHREEMCI